MARRLSMVVSRCGLVVAVAIVVVVGDGDGGIRGSPRIPVSS